jgi:hypothetical protein
MKDENENENPNRIFIQQQRLPVKGETSVQQYRLF